jgi:hypothetical protein
MSDLDKDKAFTLTYHSRIKKLQETCEDGIMVYTKITLSFALLNDLCFTELLFHPKSLGKHYNHERPDLSHEVFRKTLEDIIVYEVSQNLDKGRLTSQQLHKVIEHFRSMDRKKLN